MDLSRIVIGVDFSPASAEAARWAARHFGQNAEVILAHSVDIKRDSVPETVERATERLRDLRDTIPLEGIQLDVREGDAARSLCDVAAEVEADLLIVGARGERADLERRLGTTAQHAVRDSAIPVLVVALRDKDHISEILVAVDDDATARESLRWAALLSERFGATVTTLHVAGATGVVSHAARDDLPRDDSRRTENGASAGRDKTERWIELAEAAGIPRARVTSEEASGVPAAEIISASDRHDADFIVMGRQSASNLRRAVVGSVTATVLSHPPCSVLVVPAG